jgi:hypothetical protein
LLLQKKKKKKREEEEEADRFQKLLKVVGNVVSYGLEGRRVIPVRGSGLFLPS